ncbi:MAG: hypothetical protein HYZ53_13825 [Planctomycetes bacterium]|nr:hypothetical protein [Planctomycetota bacterium]
MARATSDDAGRGEFGRVGRLSTIYALAERQGDRVTELSRPFLLEADGPGETRRVHY